MNEVEITKLLLELGFNPAHNGFSYIRRAIGLMLDSPGVFSNASKQLYPAVADQYETSPANVERAIRFAINKAARTGNFRNKIGKYLVVERPSSNKQFLALAREFVKKGGTTDGSRREAL
ncbi:MAG: sporulation initiation factor Spo0A C-terminal domain-containing protein [Desulfitobacteriaceae bacterium]|nr:sporulation initiation factor Spo0A C-terminal domain-containing protein [Desulfitobacteriaceae bacterium]